MRNSYILFDFGDTILGSSTDRIAPFIQMLSITDPTAAHNDFVNVRLNGNPANALTGQIKPSGTAPDASSIVRKPWFYAIVSILGTIVLVGGGCLIDILRRRRRDGPGKMPQGRGGEGFFILGRGGERKYRSMGAPIPEGIDDDAVPQGMGGGMSKTLGGDEESVPLAQTHYEDPFRDHPYGS